MRTLIRHRSALATAILAIALMARLLIPAGYMPMAGQSTMALTLCTGIGMQTIEVPIERGPGKGARHPAGTSGDTHPCTYAGMGLLATGAIDAALFIAALLFAFAVALRRPESPNPSPAAFLRPPLRAPPLPA